SPLAPRWRLPASPSSHAPRPEPSHSSGRARRVGGAYTQPERVPRIRIAPALAARCSADPCSNGAASRPSHWPKSRGDTASAPTSSVGWETNTTSSRNTKARLALKARSTRPRSGWDAGWLEASIAPAWRLRPSESTGRTKKDGRGRARPRIAHPAGRERQVINKTPVRARADLRSPAGPVGQACAAKRRPAETTARTLSHRLLTFHLRAVKRAFGRRGRPTGAGRGPAPGPAGREWPATD